MTRAESTVLLAVSLVVVLAVAAVGGIATGSGLRDWYDDLDKAPWTPPSWVFGPAWTVLYVLMAVAAWLVARAGLDERAVRVALAVYLVQLAVNLAWSWLFFRWRAPALALVDIVVLCVLVAATIVAFWRVDAAAGALLAPYLGWIVFAATLNLWIVLKN